jgi:hypothetical protein
MNLKIRSIIIVHFGFPSDDTADILIMIKDAVRIVSRARILEEDPDPPPGARRVGVYALRRLDSRVRFLMN